MPPDSCWPARPQGLQVQGFYALESVLYGGECLSSRLGLRSWSPRLLIVLGTE